MVQLISQTREKQVRVRLLKPCRYEGTKLKSGSELTLGEKRARWLCLMRAAEQIAEVIENKE